MPLPDTFADLAMAGYRHDGYSHCRGCGARLEWFWTKKNRKMPFSLKTDLMVGDTAIYLNPSITHYEPHWASCPKAERFRRKK